MCWWLIDEFVQLNENQNGRQEEEEKEEGEDQFKMAEIIVSIQWSELLTRFLLLKIVYGRHFVRPRDHTTGNE